ncbi:MAG TPA: hypothetical protein VFT49_01470 [Candidatus Saccharimonadales bacterium]|nr:hypothetical protein [Candidatus Saccharimonadales bacterium]
MDDQTVSPEARTAAKWWADQLRGPARMDNGSLEYSMETGDPNHFDQAITTMGLAGILNERERSGLSDEQISVFEEALARRVQERLQQSGEFGVTIDVDYHPDYLLVDSADEAGIRVGMTLFPWKTTMWIETGSVRVSCGYRGPTEDLSIATAS